MCVNDDAIEITEDLSNSLHILSFWVSGLQVVE